jgi:hypothetical protein
MDIGVPFMITRTFLTFGFHDLLVLLTEWLTLFPKTVALLQISHFAIVFTPPLDWRNNSYLCVSSTLLLLTKAITILTHYIRYPQGLFFMFGNFAYFIMAVTLATGLCL